MRLWYVNKRREKIFRPSTLVVLACLAVVVLVAIQPRPGTFREMLSSFEPDVVALNYARVLVALDPEDAELQSLLAQQFSNLGRLAEADAVLTRLTSRNDTVSFALLHMDVLKRRLFATTDAKMKSILSKRVVTMIQGLNVDLLEMADRERVALTALAFGQPGVAAEIYLDLYAGTQDPTWLLKSARQFEAAGQPQRSARAFARAAQVEGEHQQLAIRDALRMYQAANQFDQGIEFLAQHDHHLNDPSLAFAIRFALGADAPGIAGELSRQLAARGPEALAGSDLPLSDLTLASLAINDLVTALHWANLNQARNPADANARRQLAQVLEWSDAVEASLPHWAWLAENAPDIAEMNRTWRVARSAYREDIVARILTAQSRRGALSSPAFEAWADALFATQTVDETAAQLSDYLHAHPQDAVAWRLAAERLASNEAFDPAAELWAEVAERFGLSNQDHQSMAAMRWQQFDLQGALESLRLVDVESVSQDPDHWRSLAQLAFEANEHELAQEAVRKLATLVTDLTAEEYDILLDTLPAEEAGDLRFFARRGWEQTGELRFLLSALEAEFDARSETFGSLLRQADQLIDRLNREPRYWTIKARSLAIDGHTDAAAQAYQRALALAPHFAPAVEHYAWLLIDSRRLTDLWRLIDSRPELALQHASLAAPYAYAYDALARHEEAAFWYRRAAHADPDDLFLALRFTEALRRTGQVDEALHWRRKAMLRALAKLPEEDGPSISALRQISADLISRPDFEQLVHGLSQAHQAQLVPTLIADQLDQGEWDAAWHWIGYAKASGIPLDDYPKFMEAFAARDIRGLEPFTRHERPTLRAEAQLASRLDTQALLTALQQINTRSPEADRSLLTRMAADISVNRPSGVRVSHRSSDFGTAQQATHSVELARQLDAYSLSGSAEQSQTRLDASLNRTSEPRTIHEQAITLRAARSFERDRLEVAVGHVRSDAGNLSSAALTGERVWDQNHASTLRLALAERPTETPLLRTFGRKDSLTAAHRWQPTARDTLSMQVAAESFADRAKNRLSDGWRAELGWQHAVFFERPAVFARLALSSARRAGLARGHPLLNQLVQAGFDNLLPERTDRASVGLTVAHGEPGRMNWGVPSPRYRLDVDVGYQWPDKEPTLEVNASAGFRLFGDDELAFSLSYASRPDIGLQASGFSAAISYNYRLGR